MSARILALDAKRARTVECEVSSVERFLRALAWRRDVDTDLWYHATLDRGESIAAAFACSMHAIIKDAEGDGAS